MITLGILTPFAVIVALVVTFALRTLRKKYQVNNTATTSTPPTPAKKRSFGWLWVILVLATLTLIFWPKSEPQKSGEKKSDVATQTTQPPPLQHWQLCWEKAPGHIGKTAIRLNCNTAVVERQDEILVVKYTFSGGQGIITAPKTPDGAYLGTWRDSTGTGNIFLRFTSPSSALGWQDDGEKTEKDPTSLVIR